MIEFTGGGVEELRGWVFGATVLEAGWECIGVDDPWLWVCEIEVID